MINIKPTIQIYNDEGKLTRAYDKAINKMIDVTMDVDLSQFDFDEVYEGKCKEFDDLVTKLCKQSGLGSDTIYALLLTRFTDEDEYLMDYDVMYTYGLDELEESKKSARKSMKESDDNWYKLKMLNEILDLMKKDEYNIPKLTIYGKTKWIDLDEGAIETLIKYYK